MKFDNYTREKLKRILKDLDFEASGYEWGSKEFEFLTGLCGDIEDALKGGGSGINGIREEYGMKKVEVDIDLLYKMVDYSLSYINTRMGEIEDLITHSMEEGEADYFLSARKELIDDYRALLLLQVIPKEGLANWGCQ